MLGIPWATPLNKLCVFHMACGLTSKIITLPDTHCKIPLLCPCIDMLQKSCTYFLFKLFVKILLRTLYAIHIRYCLLLCCLWFWSCSVEYFDKFCCSGSHPGVKVGLKTPRKMLQALTYNQSPVTQWRMVASMVSALYSESSGLGSSPA